MAIIRPIARWNFAENLGVVDPRFAFARASVGQVVDSDALMKTVPANHPRWEYDPVTRRGRGLLMENTRTNLFWHSRDLTQAQWTKSNITITANSANAADGTTVLDLATATVSNAYFGQSVTITAGHMVIVSVFARAAASAWTALTIQDGVNVVAAWFNLNGATGTATAGNDTVTYAFHEIENYGGGLYRCILAVYTNTTTSIAFAAAPCANDGLGAVNTNAAHFGDFMFETVSGTAGHASSLITTAGATATRSSEGLTMPVASIPGWNANEGSMMVEFITPRARSLYATPVYIGIGDTANNVVYVTYSVDKFYMYVTSGGVNQAILGASHVKVAGQRVRVAIGWKLNDIAISVQGAAPGKDLSVLMPVAPVRIGLMTSPWGTIGGGGGEPLTMAALWNVRMSDADLQAVSSPSPI